MRFRKREEARPNRSYTVGTCLNKGFPNFWIMKASSPKGRVAKEVQNFTVNWYGNGAASCVAILSLLCSWWCIWLGTVQTLRRQRLVLNVCVSASIPEHVKHSWHPECAHSSQLIPVTSFQKLGPHEAASADSFFQLLPWPLCKSFLLHEPSTTSLFLQLFFCSFRTLSLQFSRPNFLFYDRSFLPQSVPDLLTFPPFDMRVHTGPPLRWV